MGRPHGTKKIATPQHLWEHFCSYRTETKANPFIVKDWVGKDANLVKREKERPLTLDGFECWCYDNGVINDLSNYFANSGNRYEEYSTICTHIRKAIRVDQIEGGMSNMYNASITQRLNNLVDRVDTTTLGEKIESKNELFITLPNGKTIDDFKID